MADKKISQLTGATTPLAGTEEVPIVQSGATTKVSVNNLTAGKAVSALSVEVGAGAVGTPSLTTTGDTNTGIFFPAADTFAIATNGARRVTVLPDGKVGLGIDTPSQQLTMTGILLFNNNQEIRFKDTGGTERTAIYLDNSNNLNIGTSANGPVRFYAGSTYTLRGQFTTAGDFSIANGNLVIGTSGKGIDFSADGQAAGMTSELLDDYEEGTFTPIIIGTTTAGTGTYTTNSGRYTKIGDLVYIQLQIDQTNHTGTGNMRITGLPFTSQSGQQSPFVTIFNNLALTVGYFGASALGSNFGTIILYQYPTGGGGAANVPMDTSCYIELAGCYKT